MNTMMTVQFQGDTLEVCGTCREDAQVSVRRVCDALGVSVQGQMKRLASKPWATINQKLMVAEDGKERVQTMISLEALPIWLGTIEPSRVKEEVRAKLVLYQKECAKVLAAHFLGIGKPAGVDQAALAQLLAPLMKTMEGMAKAIELIAGRQEHLQQQIDRLNATLPQVGGALLRSPVNATPQATVQDRLSHLGWHEASAKHRERVRRRANAWLMMRYGQTPDVSGGPGGGGPCVYYGPQISVLDEAIRREWADALRREDRREQLSGPSLFTEAA